MTTTRPPKNQKVLLTGIGGYLGAHIGRQLLEGGYTVVGSVSSLQKRYPHLDAWLHEFGPALDLQQADLLSPYEFEKIFAEHPDIEFVIHTASPYGVKKTAGKSAEELYMRPAKEGTLNVLRAAAGIVSAKGKEELSSTDELTASRDSSIASTQASTTPPPVGSAARPTRVRKVVFTSTMGAVANSFLPGKTYTEADWNDVDNDNYQAGKTAAEKAAHAFVQDFAKTFAKKCPFDLVTLCPFAIWGPSISQTTDNASAELFKGLLRGVPPFVMDLSLGVSDVRDVARAHVLALESEMASGRYLCCGEVVHVKKDILDKVLRPATTTRPGYDASLAPSLPQHSPFFSDLTAEQREKIGTKLPKIQLWSPVMRLLSRVVLDADQAAFVNAYLGKPPCYDNSRIHQDVFGNEKGFRPFSETVLDACADLVAKGQVKLE